MVADVIVIGGGPAGATISRILAEKDVEVQLFEKKKTIGLPVRCGELLPHPSEMRRLFPKAKDAEKLIEPPQNTLANITEYTELIDSMGNKIKSRFKSNIVFRDKYDQALVERAMDAGAIIKCDSPVISVSGNGSVHVKHMGTIKQVKARVIVGADGPRSILTEGVRRKNYEFAICFTTIMDNVNVDADTVQMYFGKEYAPGAYAWIIPKGDHIANVGLGIRKRFTNNLKIKKYFRKFVKEHPTASNLLDRGRIISSSSKLVPIEGPFSDTATRRGNMICIGDAGGFVMPHVGAGIPSALLTGRIGAEAILKHLRGESELSNFERLWRKEIGNRMKNSLRIRKFTDSLLLNGSISSFFNERAQQYFDHLIRCEFPVSLRLFNFYLNLKNKVKSLS
ncbi:geranylgeranyl reductase family protein [Candidatus Borrarchaeum sp.]|uniref:geranylgeranyl reductase family protein n=1 Tax=Candidatus Borrarchaeum sp. TaxID=2846742 RepID=UPI002580E6A1|nr:geranylgeranyl reductase family protein [Candidatus Borrarchaeum sp.]